MTENQIEADVCVVGAGYAGMVAALRVAQAGKTVALLEARDRVGGRVYTTYLDDGSWVDLGGTWLGTPQKAIYDLAEEMGVETYPTWDTGEMLFMHDGKTDRYSGDIPWMNPLSMADLGMAMMWWDEEAKKIPADAPWDAPGAEEYDRMTMAEWIASGLNAPDSVTKKMLTYAVELLFCCDPAEVSLLGLLFHLKGQGGLADQMKGSERDRFVGGAAEILNRIHRKLGDSVHFNEPVRGVRQDNDGVSVTSRNLTVRAKHVIIAAPPTLASHIDYEPALPVSKRFMLNRVPTGCATKFLAVYDEPFWRADGLTGQIMALDTPIGKTMDISPKTGPGMMTGFAVGSGARALEQVSPDERKRAVLDTFVRAFGSKAARPIHFYEQDWAQEEYSCGCYMTHYGAGILRQWGKDIREPVGRIYWASTETSPHCTGNIEGAVLMGDMVAGEVVQLQNETAGQGVGR